jgi:hypothetical protein
VFVEIETVRRVGDFRHSGTRRGKAADQGRDRRMYVHDVEALAAEQVNGPSKCPEMVA